MARSIKHKGCKVEDCDNKHKGLGYCNKHYQQFRLYGEIVTTKVDPNTFIIKGKKTSIYLRNNEGAVSGIAIIDTEDLPKIKDHKWYKTTENYVSNSKQRIHHLIRPDLPKGRIDHINGNPLDNRKCNLRFCTYSQNQANKRMLNSNSSGFKGVSYHKPNKIWRSRISVKGDLRVLGYFKNKIDAAKAYDEAAIKYFGEYAKTNKMIGLL